MFGRDMKYVIFEANGLVHPILFGDHTSHSQISIKGGKAVSAGFVRMKGGWPQVYGRSESLNLDNRGELDEDIIHKAKCCDTTALFMIEFNQPKEKEDENKIIKKTKERGL